MIPWWWAPISFGVGLVTAYGVSSLGLWVLGEIEMMGPIDITRKLGLERLRQIEALAWRLHQRIPEYETTNPQFAAELRLAWRELRSLVDATRVAMAAEHERDVTVLEFPRKD